MRQSEPIWTQWVVDWDGSTVWSHASPPKTYYDAPDPVALPDANSYSQSHVLYLPRFMARRISYNPDKLPDLPPPLEYLTMCKARTIGGFIWVESRRFAEIQRTFHRYPRRV